MIKCEIFLFFFLAISSLAQETLDYETYLAPEYRLNGSFTTSALASQKEKIINPLVGLFRNEKLIAHGLIVDERGFILTKASSSVGAGMVKTWEQKMLPIRIRKRDEQTDLALWQITEPISEIPKVHWQNDLNLTHQGCWVVAGSANLEQMTLGVVSAESRAIPRLGGVMGVILEEINATSTGVAVEEVLPHSAGDRAGLRIMDRIIRVDGRIIKSTTQLKSILQKRDPGDLLHLMVKRREKQIVLRVTLGHREVAFDMFNRNLLISGPVSKRKDDFSKIIQHDLPLPKFVMGGGLFSMNGHCVGINIARVDRVTAYALPTSVVLPVLKNWLIQFP